jgi:Tol biopolymer transport system component
MARFAARVLPDGKRVVFSELHLNKDIWIVDSTRATEDRATFEGQNAYPLFTPDGSRMAFRSDRSGPLAIYLASATNTRDVVQLTEGPLDVPSSWTPDGKQLAFTRGFAATGGNTDVFVVSVDQPKQAKPLLTTTASETFPEFSPDGKWIAYISNESGRATLYVQPYPGPGQRVTISGEPGTTEPAWSKNSNELFYRGGSSIYSVRFKVSGAEFIPDKPTKLFEQLAIIGGTAVRASYDVSPDGRFLLNIRDPEPDNTRFLSIFPARLRLVLNWTDEVRQLVQKK